jgi:hypothetical protein
LLAAGKTYAKAAITDFKVIQPRFKLLTLGMPKSSGFSQLSWQGSRLDADVEK